MAQSNANMDANSIISQEIKGLVVIFHILIIADKLSVCLSRASEAYLQPIRCFPRQSTMQQDQFLASAVFAQPVVARVVVVGVVMHAPSRIG
jgi:hypothetical protein